MFNVNDELLRNNIEIKDENSYLLICTTFFGCKINPSNNEQSGTLKICRMIYKDSTLDIDIDLINSPNKNYQLFINGEKMDSNCYSGSSFCSSLLETRIEVLDKKIKFHLRAMKKLEKINVKLLNEASATVLERSDETITWVDKYNEDNCQTTFSSQLEFRE